MFYIYLVDDTKACTLIHYLFKKKTCTLIHYLFKKKKKKYIKNGISIHDSNINDFIEAKH